MQYNDHEVTVFKKQELIRRWDSERELFYDVITHVLKNTEKEEPISFNKLDDSKASTAH